MNGAPAFFELGVEDADKARDFYSALFGWNLPPSPGGGGYMISTPTLAGGLHGGDQGASPYLFFAVDDMEMAADRVRALGGTIEETDLDEDPDSVALHGRFRLCQDNQGSRFGLHQPPSSRS